MDMVQLARDLRLAVTNNLFEQGLLTEEDAREILSGPLEPGDETTIFDDSALLRCRPQCPVCKGWGRFDMGGYLEECPECSGTGDAPPLCEELLNEVGDGYASL